MRRNGLDVDLLEGVVDGIRSQPDAAKVTIRTHHCWDDGLGVDGSARALENAGDITPRTWVFRTDWPANVAGRDSGPTPGEVILAALGGCVGMTYVLKAAMLGIAIDELEAIIEAEWDVQGLFELGSAGAGLSDVAVVLHIRSEACDRDLLRAGETTTRTSAVFNSLAHPVPIELSVRRMNETIDAQDA